MVQVLRSLSVVVQASVDAVSVIWELLFGFLGCSFYSIAILVVQIGALSQLVLSVADSLVVLLLQLIVGLGILFLEEVGSLLSEWFSGFSDLHTLVDHIFSDFGSLFESLLEVIPSKSLL